MNQNAKIPGLRCYLDCLAMALLLLGLLGCTEKAAAPRLLSSSDAGRETLYSNLQIYPSSAVQTASSTMRFRALATLRNGGTTEVTDLVTWTSNSSVASFALAAGTRGWSTANAAGITEVQASLSGLSAKTDLTVTSASLIAIEISPNQSQFPKGVTKQFTATALFSDGRTYDVTDQVAWVSGNTGVARASDALVTDGHVLMVAAGTTNLYATMDGVTGSTSVTVTNTSLSSLQISDSTLDLPRGLSHQLTLTGIYSDNSTVDLTLTASWASSSTGVVSVNTSTNPGRLTAGQLGVATITASVGTMNAISVVRVLPAAVASLSLSPQNVTLARGSVRAFTLNGVFSDGSSADLTSQATWSSDASAIAFVSNSAGTKGRVTATNVGATTVRASYGGLGAASSVIVSSATLSSLSVTPASLSIGNGRTNQFTATGTYSDGSSLDLTALVTWSSSAPAVATISNGADKGLATSLAAGVTTITATLGAVSDAAALTVTSAVLNSIDLSPTAPIIPKGSNVQLTAQGNYSDGSVVDLTSVVTWSSAATSVATVGNTSGKGLVHAVAVGTSNVSATYLGETGTTNVTVTSATLNSLQITPPSPTVAKGFNQQFEVVGTYSDGTSINLTSAVSWTIGNNSVATIGNAGVAKGLADALAVGNTTVVATLGAVVANASLTVSAATLVRIEFDPTVLSLPQGLGQNVTATGIYSDGSTVDLTSQLDWTSSNTSVATVSAGGVSAVGVGTATITAMIGGTSAHFGVTVSSATLASIAVTAAQTSFARGSTMALVATGTYTDNSTQNLTSAVSWGSATPTIISVSNNAGTKGLATAVNTGTATITAVSGSVSGTIDLTGTSAVLASIAVTPALPSIAKGHSQSLVATGTYSDASTADLTASATWTSADATNVPVSNSVGTKGQVWGLNTGSAVVTAAVGAVSGQTTVSVTAATLVSIAVTHSGTNLAKGLTRQLVATGTYSDASTVDLSSSVVWSSNSPLTASVSNASGTKGLVTGLLVGSADIVATMGSVSNFATVNVSAAELVSISVTPNNPTVVLLTWINLTATATYTDGSTVDVTQLATWVSADTLLVFVNNTAPNKGRTRGLLGGSATVTATYGGKSASANFHGI